MSSSSNLAKVTILLPNVTYSKNEKETIRNKLKALLLQKITFEIIYLKFIDFFLSISFSLSLHQFSNKLRGLYYELYSATLYLYQMEAVMFIIPQYFSTCGKIVYEQLTVDGVGGLLSVSSEMIL